MRRPEPARRSFAAAAALLALAAAFAFRRLDDFDTWWHLAAGRFIATEGTIPRTDVLSHTVRDHPWINLQWAFDVVIYLLHATGGPVLLSLAAACGFTLAVWLLFRLVRAEAGESAGAVLALLVVLAAQDRFNVRPEMASFPLLMIVLAILERAKGEDGRGAWRLIPLLLLWANVHALFVIGAFAIVCAIASAPSKRLAGWGAAAIATALLNPFGLRGALFPLKLLSRIDRSEPAFQAIAEFRSPFAPDVFGVAPLAYKVLLVGGTAAVVAAVIVRLRSGDRRVDYGGAAFYAGLAALSVLARRNLALFAFGATPAIATALSILAGASRGRGRVLLEAARRPVARGVTAAALLLTPAVATGWFYRWDAQTHGFGGGVLEGIFPARAAAFARDAGLPGRLYNDLAAGGYLAWDDPIGDGVFIDGRLEVYDTAFYRDYVDAMYDPARWDAAADRYRIATVILFHHWENRRQLIQRLIQDARWALVYADEAAVVFVRRNGYEAAIARAGERQAAWNARTKAWLERPPPRWRFDPGRVAGTRAFARLLAILGDGDGSVAEYRRLFDLGISRREEAEIRLSFAKYFREVGRWDEARREIDRVLEIDPGNREARAMRTP